MKQVVGIKLQLKAGFGFAKPGMPADGDVLVEGNTWPKVSQLVISANPSRDDGARRPAGRRCAVRPSRFAGLTKRYGALEAVRGIDLEVREREIFGLIGPDGAGKTSTFQILAGVMEATSGDAEHLWPPGARDAVADRLPDADVQPVSRSDA